MRLPHHRPVDSDPISLRRLVTAGLVQILDADDPLDPLVIVRLAGRDRYSHDDTATPPVVAALLASIYTRPGDTIATVGADDGFDAVCAGAGRRYRALSPWIRPADTDAGSFALVVLRTDIQPAEDATVARYARLLTPTGRLAVVNITDDRDAGIHLHTAGDLRRMADAGRRPPWKAPPVTRSAGQAMAATNHISVHSDIAVFSVRT